MRDNHITKRIERTSAIHFAVKYLLKFSLQLRITYSLWSSSRRILHAIVLYTGIMKLANLRFIIDENVRQINAICMQNIDGITEKF